ncbi:CocE/NonD family hydrolase [Amycolatopsis jejuensis]|uniref:CocE/NonD family hydrolase n=1 Tax=Amycolatopsis jejuensis TaxID=330084 RepID=UPI000527C0F5|nr:CocE/NonD family hydrolase [Amycolatopsis jejuensis]
MVDVAVTPFEIEARTRAGDLVRADVYLPEGVTGPVPVLLGASPYQKSLRWLPPHPIFPFTEYGPMQFYLDHGYAYVAMDLPGTGRSEGTWDPVSRQEGEAIHDLIEHLAGQEWSTGAIGMIGMSHYTWSQWNAARTRPPHLKTIVAYDGATDMYRDWMYHGGIPTTQGFFASWLFGSVLVQHQLNGIDFEVGDKHQFVYEALRHPLDDEWQRRRSPYWELDQVDIPVFSVGVWGKGSLHLRGNFTGYERVKGPKQLLVAHPDSFAGAQQYFFDEEFHRAEVLPWYEHHLKGVDNGVMDRPNVRFFVNNENVYREAETWPPPDGQPSAFYLSGVHSGTVTSLNDGSLTEEKPVVAEESTSWSYPDPQWRAGVTIFDHEGKPDHTARVNTFTSAPMDRDREFTGQGVLTLHASSDQEDLDLIVSLYVVPESGRPKRVSQGWLRASHRAEDPDLTTPLRPFHSHQKVEPLTPGTVYELRVELLPMSFLARAGDRIRLTVSNHDSAILDAPMTHFYGQKVGTDTYHHDQVHPSALELQERPR